MEHQPEPRGLSLHIGVNALDPSCYHGWFGRLMACERDALKMKALATACHYETDLLLTEAATKAQVTQAIQLASARLKAGDIFFLSYAGHGINVPNAAGGERWHQSWCLYDGVLLDDELHDLWCAFEGGVRILVLSDSCRSGRVIRGPKRPSSRPSAVKASVRLLSGADDTQASLENVHGGFFTNAVVDVWDDGAFRGNYDHFHECLRIRLQEHQRPRHTMLGPTLVAFDTAKPFEIAINVNVNP